jgi:hypothetical protein
MNRRALWLAAAGTALTTVPWVTSCSSEGDSDGMAGGSAGVSAGPGAAGADTAGTSGANGATAGRASSGASGASASGGGVVGGGAPSAGASGAAQAGASGNAAGGGAGGGATGGAGGSATGGAGGAAGTGVAGNFVGGGTGGGPIVEDLDCGDNGTALEAQGPPLNRVNYVIVADGYSEAELLPDGALDQHLAAMLKKRFSEPIGQPYLRYRKFVNICVLRIPSSPICGSSVFGCCGSDSSRLASCDNTAVRNAIRDNLPESFEVDWNAVVLNGSSWWNSGGTLMMWSGGNESAGGAALHEGGHGFHALSDEYDNCELGRVSNEASYGVNVSTTDEMTGGKWDGWLGYDHVPGTGVQGFFACAGNQTWRPSSNSMMNQLFGDDPNTSYNPVSREKIVMDIWRAVESPYDAVTPSAGPVSNPTELTVHVIDPAVISVDWSVDGTVVALDGGPTYAIGAASLAPGTHTVTARAYDNAGMDLVRQVPGTTFNRQFWGSGAMGHSDKTVTWTVTIE